MKLDILSAFALVAIAAINYAFWRWTKTRKRRAIAGRPLEKPPVIEPLTDFDWQTSERRKLRPFKPVYHITMGLKTDSPSELITIDRDYLERINLRRSLIKAHGNTVHGHVPSGEDAVSELYTYLVASHLPVRFPAIFKLSSDKASLENTATGTSLLTKAPCDTNAALRALGEFVEEDMFLLRETPQGYSCVAFLCCFPSGFDPSEKLGRSLREIHAPVPAYEKIGPSMERFFAKLEVGKPVKRVNWSVQTHMELFNCEGNHTKADDEVIEDADIDISQAFLRTELQTLSRLPTTQALLFSFKTYLYPLQELKDEGLGPEFADAIEGLQKGNAAGMWTYKSAVRWGKSVCEYLRS